jgi:hypothetical protein
MAKKSTTTNANRKSTPAAVKGRSTAVRNSAIPKVQAIASGAHAGASKSVTHDMIARRAYEIWQSGQGGTEHDNWIRAERELRGGAR